MHGKENGIISGHIDVSCLQLSASKLELRDFLRFLLEICFADVFAVMNNYDLILASVGKVI
jgi:hypothetical protein